MLFAVLYTHHLAHLNLDTKVYQIATWMPHWELSGIVLLVVCSLFAALYIFDNFLLFNYKI